MTVHVLTKGARGRKAPASLPAINPDVLSWLAGDLEDDRLNDAPAPDYGDDPDQPQYLRPRGDYGYGSGKGKASPVTVNPATGEPGRIVPVC